LVRLRTEQALSEIADKLAMAMLKARASPP
jgi:hypothetical protein